MKFTYSVPMRFSDTDALGHVNNARFLSYLEDTRVAFLAYLGSRSAFAPDMILARVEIDYLRPLLVDTTPVEVTSWITRLGSKSFTMAHEIRHHDDIVAKGMAVIVGYDYANQQSRTLTDVERAALDKYVQTTP